MYRVCTLKCMQGPLVAAALLAACAAWAYRQLSKQVYLLDFSCYRPADEYQVTWKRFMAGSRECGVSLLTQLVCQLCPAVSHCQHSCMRYVQCREKTATAMYTCVLPENSAHRLAHHTNVMLESLLQPLPAPQHASAALVGHSVPEAQGFCRITMHGSNVCTVCRDACKITQQVHVHSEV